MLPAETDTKPVVSASSRIALNNIFVPACTTALRPLAVVQLRCIARPKRTPPPTDRPDRSASDSNIPLEYANIGLDLRGRPLVHDMAIVDDVNAARQRQSGGDVLLDQDDSLPSAGKVATGAHQVLHNH